MDNNAVTGQQPTGPRPLSRRDVVGDELAQLHAPLGIEPPTATLTIDQLEVEVNRLRVQPVAKPRRRQRSWTVPCSPTTRLCQPAIIARGLSLRYTDTHHH